MASDLDIIQSGGPLLPGESFLKEGERRTVTVLFSDMKGFTSLSERADPEAMDALMTEIFAKFEAVIRRYGGFVEKYIGDALVAVFGVPEVHEDDPRRAIGAALDMIGVVRRYRPPEGLEREDLQFRTGVHTGLVTTGRRGQFDVVTGHTLAVAARLQTSAPPDGVLVSEATKEKCERSFIFSDAEEFKVKGKDERIVAYRALSRRKAQFAYDGPFVGRERELEALTASYLRLMRGEPSAAYVTGDSGIGKTRLCSELYGKLRSLPNYHSTYLAVNAAQYSSFDYSTMMYTLLDWLESGPELTEREFSSRLAERLSLDPAVAATAYAAFQKADVPEPRMHDALGAIFDALLSLDDNLYPDIVFIDNARFMDAKSRDFVRAYLSRSANKPFILLSDRIADEGIARLFGIAGPIALGPLQDEAAVELVNALSPDGFAPETVGAIVKRAQGYPLFIEEYVKLLRKRTSEKSVPDTIQNAILSSIERISPEARSLLQKVSVFRFPVSVGEAAFVSSATDGPQEVAPVLDALASERLLVKLADDRYAFKHPIIKDSVYSTLLLHNRKILHSLAARLRMRDERPSGEEVFYHLASSEDWQQATSYLLNERPRLGIESAPLVQSLIDNAPPDDAPTLVELLFQKYAVHYNNDALEGIEDIIFEMFKISMRERNPAMMARAYHLYMTWLSSRGMFADAAFYGLKSIDLYQLAGNVRGLANSLLFFAEASIGLGDFERARAAIERMPREDDWVRRLYAMARANFHYAHGDYAETKEWNARLEEGAHESGDETEAQHRRLLGILNVTSSYEFAKALDYENYSPNPGVLSSEEILRFYVALAMGLQMCGRVDKARERLVAAEYYYRQVRDEFKRSSHGASLGYAYFVLDDMTTCRERAERALLESIKTANYIAMFELDILLAETALMSGNRKEFSFFVREASYLHSRPFYRERKTELRYNFFAYLVCAAIPADGAGDVGAGEAEPAPFEGHELSCSTDARNFLSEAQRLLAEELAEMKGTGAEEFLFRFEVFRRLRDLGASKEGAGQA